MTAPLDSDRSSGQVEERAQAFQGRRVGFYVLNPVTDLAVAGPYEMRKDAEHEALVRNTTPPVPADLLVVRRLGHRKGGT